MPDDLGVGVRIQVFDPEGWNFLMRIYRPGRSVLEGAYTLPAAKPVR